MPLPMHHQRHRPMHRRQLLLMHRPMRLRMCRPMHPPPHRPIRRPMHLPMRPPIHRPMRRLSRPLMRRRLRRPIIIAMILARTFAGPTVKAQLVLRARRQQAMHTRASVLQAIRRRMRTSTMRHRTCMLICGTSASRRYRRRMHRLRRRRLHRRPFRRHHRRQHRRQHHHPSLPTEATVARQLRRLPSQHLWSQRR